MLSTRQLRYFEVLAETLHFGRAAQRLNISQPALSAQIAGFEERIGAKLVERRPSGVVLTAEGAAILGRVQSILSEIRDLETLGAARGEALSGQLRIGLIATVAPYLLPRLLPRLSLTHTDLQLAIRENLTDLLVADIMAGELDCAIVALPVGDASLSTIEIGRDPFRLAVPTREGHRFKGAVDVGDLSSERLILLEEGHCLRDQALKVCHPVETHRFADLSATSLATILRMVAGGLGATLIPEIAVEAEAQSGDVEMLRFHEPAPFRTLALAFRRSSTRRRTFEALAEVLRACLP